MNLNYRLSVLISIINVALRNHFVRLKIVNCPLYFRILYILQKNGVVMCLNYSIKYITVFFKYKKGIPCFSLKVISKPGNRKRWTLSKLQLNANGFGFSGIYLISTSEGILTSNECLGRRRISGEILLKVEY